MNKQNILTEGAVHVIKDELTNTGALQCLSFILGDETFAFEISKVREVLDYTEVVKVPRMPDFMIGVINLRGNVIPVVDLRQLFRMEKADKTVNTCIIIAEIRDEEEMIIIGALVDSVKEVFDVETNMIEPPPRIGHIVNSEFIKGMAKHNDRFIMNLDIDRILTIQDMEELRGVDLRAANQKIAQKKN
jgi:purine-binding chemotaxis protein CheW